MIVYSTLNALTLGGFLLPALALGYSELAGSRELDLILNGLISSVSGIIASEQNPNLAIRQEGFRYYDPPDD